MRNIKNVMAVVFIMLLSTVVNAEVAIIINLDSSISMSNIKVIKKIFLGKTSTLDGQQVSNEKKRIKAEKLLV